MRLNQETVVCQMANFMVTSSATCPDHSHHGHEGLCCWKEGEQSVVHREARSGAPTRGGPKRPARRKRLQERLGRRNGRGRRSGWKAELRPAEGRISAQTWTLRVVLPIKLPRGPFCLKKKI